MAEDSLHSNYIHNQPHIQSFYFTLKAAAVTSIIMGNTVYVDENVKLQRAISKTTYLRNNKCVKLVHKEMFIYSVADTISYTYNITGSQ
jgi:hypothetical protein